MVHHVNGGFVIAMSVLAAPSPQPAPEVASGRVRITTGHVAVRRGPAPNHRVIGYAKLGEEYDVLERRAGWLRVSFAGQSGWLFRLFAEPLGVGDTYEVRARQLNARKGAGVDHPVEMTLKRGDLVRVLTRKLAWRQIDYRGQKGWVHGQWLRLSKRQLPAAGPVAPRPPAARPAPKRPPGGMAAPRPSPRPAHRRTPARAPARRAAPRPAPRRPT